MLGAPGVAAFIPAGGLPVGISNNSMYLECINQLSSFKANDDTSPFADGFIRPLNKSDISEVFAGILEGVNQIKSLEGKKKGLTLVLKNAASDKKLNAFSGIGNDFKESINLIKAINDNGLLEDFIGVLNIASAKSMMADGSLVNNASTIQNAADAFLNKLNNKISGNLNQLRIYAANAPKLAQSNSNFLGTITATPNTVTGWNPAGTDIGTLTTTESTTYTNALNAYNNTLALDVNNAANHAALNAIETALGTANTNTGNLAADKITAMANINAVPNGLTGLVGTNLGAVYDFASARNAAIAGRANAGNEIWADPSAAPGNLRNDYNAFIAAHVAIFPNAVPAVGDYSYVINSLLNPVGLPATRILASAPLQINDSVSLDPAFSPTLRKLLAINPNDNFFTADLLKILLNGDPKLNGDNYNFSNSNAFGAAPSWDQMRQIVDTLARNSNSIIPLMNPYKLTLNQSDWTNMLIAFIAGKDGSGNVPINSGFVIHPVNIDAAYSNTRVIVPNANAVCVESNKTFDVSLADLAQAFNNLVKYMTSGGSFVKPANFVAGARAGNPTTREQLMLSSVFEKAGSLSMLGAAAAAPSLNPLNSDANGNVEIDPATASPVVPGAGVGSAPRAATVDGAGVGSHFSGIVDLVRNIADAYYMDDAAVWLKGTIDLQNLGDAEHFVYEIYRQKLKMEDLNISKALNAIFDPNFDLKSCKSEIASLEAQAGKDMEAFDLTKTTSIISSIEKAYKALLGDNDFNLIKQLVEGKVSPADAVAANAARTKLKALVDTKASNKDNKHAIEFQTNFNKCVPEAKGPATSSDVLAMLTENASLFFKEDRDSLEALLKDSSKVSEVQKKLHEAIEAKDLTKALKDLLEKINSETSALTEDDKKVIKTVSDLLAAIESSEYGFNHENINGLMKEMKDGKIIDSNLNVGNIIKSCNDLLKKLSTKYEATEWDYSIKSSNVEAAGSDLIKKIKAGQSTSAPEAVDVVAIAVETDKVSKLKQDEKDAIIKATNGKAVDKATADKVMAIEGIKSDFLATFIPEALNKKQDQLNFFERIQAAWHLAQISSDNDLLKGKDTSLGISIFSWNPFAGLAYYAYSAYKSISSLLSYLPFAPKSTIEGKVQLTAASELVKNLTEVKTSEESTETGEAEGEKTKKAAS